MINTGSIPKLLQGKPKKVKKVKKVAKKAEAPKGYK
jgi:hypothetical protein